MLIAPPTQSLKTAQKKLHFYTATVHWILMGIFWVLLLAGTYCTVSIRIGTFIKSDNTVLISAVFALALLMAAYSIGVTLFYFTIQLLNKFQDKKYDFFIKLNSLMLLAFAILWTFALITF